MLFEGIFGHPRQEFSGAVPDALVQVSMQIAAEGSVLLVDGTDLIVDHELLIEAVALRCLVISVHKVVNGDRFGTVVFTDPVGVRQVDTDRRCRIAVARQDSCGDDFGGHTFDFLFLVFRVGCGVILEPLRVSGNQLRTFGCREVFEVDHRLPCAGDAERIGIGLCETIDVVHAAVKVFDPSDAVLVKSRQITCLIERDHLLNSKFLGIVLGIFQCLFEPINDMLEGFAI